MRGPLCGLSIFKSLLFGSPCNHDHSGVFFVAAGKGGRLLTSKLILILMLMLILTLMFMPMLVLLLMLVFTLILTFLLVCLLVLILLSAFILVLIATFISMLVSMSRYCIYIYIDIEI